MNNYKCFICKKNVCSNTDGCFDNNILIMHVSCYSAQIYFCQDCFKANVPQDLYNSFKWKGNEDFEVGVKDPIQRDGRVSCLALFTPGTKWSVNSANSLHCPYCDITLAHNTRQGFVSVQGYMIIKQGQQEVVCPACSAVCGYVNFKY